MCLSRNLQAKITRISFLFLLQTFIQESRQWPVMPSLYLWAYFNTWTAVCTIVCVCVCDQLIQSTLFMLHIHACIQESFQRHD